MIAEEKIIIFIWESHNCSLDIIKLKDLFNNSVNWKYESLFFQKKDDDHFFYILRGNIKK